VERAQRSGGLHKRSAEAWGHPLRARGAVHSLPLAAFAVVLVFQEIRAGVAGRNEVVTKLRSGDRKGGTQMLSLKRSGFGIVRFVAELYQA